MYWISSLLGYTELQYKFYPHQNLTHTTIPILLEWLDLLVPQKCNNVFLLLNITNMQNTQNPTEKMGYETVLKQLVAGSPVQTSSHLDMVQLVDQFKQCLKQLPTQTSN